MTVCEFKEKIASAAWNQNPLQFCESAGFDPNSEYAQQKFSDFQEMAVLLNKFDSENLAAIISAEKGGAVFKTWATVPHTLSRLSGKPVVMWRSRSIRRN